MQKNPNNGNETVKDGNKKRNRYRKRNQQKKVDSSPIVTMSDIVNNMKVDIEREYKSDANNMNYARNRRLAEYETELINKNIELLSSQLKLLDIKLDAIKNQLDKKEPFTPAYPESPMQKMPPGLQNIVLIDEKSLNQPGKKDGSSSPFQIGNNPMLGPLSILFENIEKKKQQLLDKPAEEPIEESVEEEEEIDPKEHIEELGIEVNTIYDLIKLGELYDKIKGETTKEKEYIKHLKKRYRLPVDDKVRNNGLKRITIDDKDVTMNSEVDENYFKIPSNNTVKSDPFHDSININPQVKKVKPYYEIYGKKYSVNLEVLNKLIKPLKTLSGMIGLEDVKNAVVDTILYYVQNFERKNNNMLHTRIEGPPGVGKTEFGKILAEIYAGLGVIKSNKFKIVKRSDLIGKYVGHTAIKTQEVIDEAEGGVLFIDEAYSLGNEEKKDSFSKECIDTLNQNLSENKRKFICIIAGYPEELEKCFFSINSGLKRRFPFRFTIDGYKPDELCDIFIKKVNDSKWKFSDDFNNKKALCEFFVKNKDKFPYFGGDVENLIVSCRFAHSRRIFGKHPSLKKKINKDDLDIGFKRYVEHKKSDEVPESVTRMFM